MDKQFHPILYGVWDYLYMLGLKLNRISERGQGGGGGGGGGGGWNINYQLSAMIHVVTAIDALY